MTNTQYNPYLWPNRRNFRVLKEIWVEEHDGYVTFQTESGNTDVSRACVHCVHFTCLWDRHHVPQKAFLVWYNNVNVGFFRFITIHSFDRRTNRRTHGFATAKTTLHTMQRSKNKRQ